LKHESLHFYSYDDITYMLYDEITYDIDKEGSTLTVKYSVNKRDSVRQHCAASKQTISIKITMSSATCGTSNFTLPVIPFYLLDHKREG